MFKKLPLLLIFFFPYLLFAQTTVVSGTVTDAATKQPMPFVAVSFTGTALGTTTNNLGKYSMKSTGPYNRISISFAGYKKVEFAVAPGREQIINAHLVQETKALEEVVIKSPKKEKYRNKGNPAVELIRNVIAHKPQNRPEAYPYVEYKSYDKVQMSFVNVAPTFSDKKFFKKYKFMLDNRDTTIVPGKSLLPVYLDEKLSQSYYRKNPEKLRTITLGEKRVSLGAFLDESGFAQYMKHIYGEVDIYSNNIFLLTNQFLSPIADAAPTFYKFFITDTVVVDNRKLIELSFTPRNTTDMLFEGEIYISLDSNYAVQKAHLLVNKHINLNFVKSLDVYLDFDQNPDQRYHLSKSNTVADFGLNKNGKGGLFGQRTISYKDYIVNQPRPDTAYEGLELVISDAAKHRSEAFWQKNRLDTLTTAESKVYSNVDSLNRMPSFRRTMDIATLLLAGYKSFGGFEVGPSNTFYSFNPVEGLRLRLGGRTTPELSKRYYFETYAAYGFKDERWKHFLSATYSLNDKSIYQFPQNYVRLSHQYDTSIPGEAVSFVQEDNFLLSFKRGEHDKYIYNDFYKFNYVHEYLNHFSYNLQLVNWTQSPAGSLYFVSNETGVPDVRQHLTTTTASLTLRYAPHEQFYQGKIYRIPIPTKYPVFAVQYTQGFSGVLNSQYSYKNLYLQFDKHFYMSQIGYSDLQIKGGKIFGQLPYPLLTIHTANQTYGYESDYYNLMNFLEFASDHYASARLEHHFNGFIFNKIPLLKRLKLREVAAFKILYGGVSDINNPALHSNLYQFPVTSSGAPITYSLGKTPYTEASVGIENIFKFIQVDLVKRFNYLDHPDIAKWGIRTQIRFDL